jgi:hypothetical protein
MVPCEMKDVCVSSIVCIGWLIYWRYTKCYSLLKSNQIHLFYFAHSTVHSVRLRCWQVCFLRWKNQVFKYSVYECHTSLLNLPFSLAHLLHSRYVTLCQIGAERELVYDKWSLVESRQTWLRRCTYGDAFHPGLVNTRQGVFSYCFHYELPSSTLEWIFLIRNSE